MTKAEFLEKITFKDMPNAYDTFSIDFFVTILDEVNTNKASLVYNNKVITNVTLSFENETALLNGEEIAFTTLSDWFDEELQVLLS